MTTGIVDLLNLDNGGFDFPGFESTGANPLSPADSSISTSSWNSWSSQPVYILPHSLPRHVTMKLTGYARFYTVHSAPPFFAYYSALALALAVDQFKSVAQSVAQSISRQQQQQHLGASVGFSNDVGANNPTKSFLVDWAVMLVVHTEDLVTMPIPSFSTIMKTRLVKFYGRQ